MTEHIVIEREAGVQTIRMNRADKKNALTRAMYATMAAALAEADESDEIRVSVLMGVPGAFTSGNDIADFMSYSMGGEQGMEVYDFLMALAQSKTPIVSAVDGISVGIGTTIQFHCDLTFATPRTVFHTPFVDLGVVPEAGSSLLGPATLGRQGAFALLALCEGLPAERAKAAGMIHAVIGEGEVEVAALEAAKRIAAKPPEAMRIARDLLLGDRDALIDRIRHEGKLFRERLQSKEARNAFMAFMNRKK